MLRTVYYAVTHGMAGAASPTREKEKLNTSQDSVDLTVDATAGDRTEAPISTCATLLPLYLPLNCDMQSLDKLARMPACSCAHPSACGP